MHVSWHEGVSLRAEHFPIWHALVATFRGSEPGALIVCVSLHEGSLAASNHFTNALVAAAVQTPRSREQCMRTLVRNHMACVSCGLCTCTRTCIPTLYAMAICHGVKEVHCRTARSRQSWRCAPFALCSVSHVGTSAL